MTRKNLRMLFTEEKRALEQGTGDSDTQEVTKSQ